MVKLITMTISSNTYADKIYSENPIALWALDEELPEDLSGSFTLPYQSPIANVHYLYTGAEARAYRYGSANDSDYGYYAYLPFSITDSSSDFWTAHSTELLAHEDLELSTLYTRVSSDSVPLVYGSQNVAEMYPANIPTQPYMPSILLPGKGFLNESGKFSDMTLEFWIKVINYYGYYDATRIIGPVASDDGLYLYNRSLVLKIGNNSCSAFLGGFQKPMLVDISISANSASIIVNGEVLASMVIDMSKIDLPTAFNNGLEQDWLAFSANMSHSINLDCVAIYNYSVPDIVAKKRFTYGQAVEYPQSVLAKHGGQTYAIDGAFANFAKTVKFPQTNTWQSGTFSNLTVSDDKLKLPEYSLPEFYAIDHDGNDISKTWTGSDIVPLAYNTYHGFDFFPGIEFMSDPDKYAKQYISFNGLPVKSSKLHSFMLQLNMDGVMDKEITSDKILFKLLDKTSQDYFIGKLHIQTETVDETYPGYYFKTYFVKSDTSPYSYSAEALDSSHGYVYSEFTPTRGLYGSNMGSDSSQFLGIDLSYIKENNPVSFLNGNSDNWILYVGGDNTDASSFTGYVSKVLFVDADIAEALPAATSQPRFVDGRYIGDCSEMVTYSLVFNHVGSYYYPDISLCGYWLQNIPFSRLSSTVDEVKSLDFIQVNTFVDENTYSNSSYKTYASIADVAENDLSQIFVTYSGISDGTILASSKDQSDAEFINQYVNIIVSLQSKGILSENPSVKKIQVSSRINDMAHPIGSKFGIAAYPFGPLGKKNYYSVSMGSSPYNYLTDISGISLLGQQPYTNFDGACDTGIRIPINANNSNDFYIQSLQMYYKPLDSTFERFATLGFGYDSNYNAYWYPLFDIYSQTSYIPSGYSTTIPMNHLRIKALRVSNRMVRLVCVNISDGIETDITEHITFTINGHVTTGNINIETLEWSIIGILFPTPLNMSGQGYSLDIIGPGVFNNILYLKIPKDDLFSRIVGKTWEQVLESHTWQDILDISVNWQDTYLDEVPAVYTVTPEYLYDLYQGTNRIVVASNPEKSDMSVKYISSSLYKNVLWLSENIKPV